MRAAFVLALAITLSGCFGYSVTTGLRGDGVRRTGRGSVVFRVIPAQHVASECTHGIARIKTYMPWWAPIAAVFSLGIAVPWRASYECAAAPEPVAPPPPPPAPRLVVPPE